MYECVRWIGGCGCSWVCYIFIIGLLLFISYHWSGGVVIKSNLIMEY